MNTLITGNVKFYSQTQNKSFINELRKYPPMTDAEEKEAFTKLKNGDRSVIDEIAKRNQRWVYSVAKEFARNEIEVMDYVQEGNKGLLKAIDEFDIDRGYKFITFMVWYLRREMNSYLNTNRDIITKSNNAKLCKKIERVKNDFFVRNGYMPTYDEIRDLLQEKYDINVVNIADLYDLELMSINEYVGGDSYTLEDSNDFTAATSSENLANKDEEREYYKELVMPVLEKLNSERPDLCEFIKKLYHIGYDEDFTVSQLCMEYGLDEEGLRSLENKILKYMRQEFFEVHKEERKTA